MKKKVLLVSIVVVVIALTTTIAIALKNNNPRADSSSSDEQSLSESGLIRQCPDAWIDDQMPQVIDDTASGSSTQNDLPGQYFVIDGIRKELKYYDVAWIQANCDVEKAIAY